MDFDFAEDGDEEFERRLAEASALRPTATGEAVAAAGPSAPLPGGGRTVQLGNLTVTASVPADRTRVPFLPVPRGVPFSASSQGTLKALKWMFQKGQLRQDMFLLGEPGPELRHLVYLYCIILGKELDYVSITRDTSESDLKQRREIVGGCLRFVDQPPVSAAKNGRVLLLEGIEKAERNVLPTLNNLLENREMALEDRTFLVAPERAADAGRLPEHIPVSEAFEVIAIGQPGRGNPLDPPLRSRFVAFNVRPRSLRNETGEELSQLAQNMSGAADPPLETLRQLVTFAQLLVACQGSQGANLADAPPETDLPPLLPDVALGGVARLLTVLKGIRLDEVLPRVFPVRLLRMTDARAKAIKSVLDASSLGQNLLFGAVQQERYAEVWRIVPVRGTRSVCILEFHGGSAVGTSTPVQATCGPAFHAEKAIESPLSSPTSGVLLTGEQKNIVARMMQDHAVGVDVCLVGERGAGKSLLVRAFCESLGYQPHIVFCYKDMVSRDLLQRRSTDNFGNTTWHNSPLLLAAVSGQVAVLDGVHRLAKGMLYSAVGRLLHDRELELADGSRYVSPEHFERLISEGTSAEELNRQRIHRVHPAFRIIALAEPPGNTNESAWLTAEVCTLFHFQEVRPLPTAELREVCLPSQAGQKEYGHADSIKALDALVGFAEAVRDESERSEEAAADLAAMSLSLRQLKRAGQHLLATQGDAAGAAERAFSARLHFLQPSAQARVNDMLVKSMRRANVRGFNGIRRSGVDALLSQSGRASVVVRDGVLDIGGVECPQRCPLQHELVPEVDFVDTPQHVEALRQMLLGWSLGHHLLLVGNQGTGKNKVTDRLLQLLQCEREYVQLHRDTTVQSLLLSQSLEAGVVQREDSALVRAVKAGRCLVVDEADKASLEVVCVLKALADDGELVLGDGRCIVRRGDPRAAREGGARADLEEEVFIETGEGFRLIVLANRPGFPFLGNDFFRVCGDVFSCHVVDNPNIASEMTLLESCGPSVDRAHLERLARLFAELREMADSGRLAYPYSTRELVKVARHLNEFPSDPIELALSDVFSFDLADAGKRMIIYKVLMRHGLATTDKTKALLGGQLPSHLEFETEELPNEQQEGGDA